MKKSKNSLSFRGVSFFFLETGILWVIPPKYEAGLKKKSTFFDDGGRGVCRRPVGFFGFFLQASPLYGWMA